MARTYKDVQKPMAYDWEPAEDPVVESAKELKRQKGFSQAQNINEYMEKYKTKGKVRMEIDPFMQWDRPREEV